jgi:branched-chain amino acid transport system substrate-binding protein
MTQKMNLISAVLGAALASASLCTASQAGDAPQPVKIGVLTDMSGMYRDIMGPGSVLAAKMAVADFGS